ncbi:MAG: sporulation protein YqfD [Clostridia bacterium]|nr:sporulation protein YqfD [Clostridia bacterium]
MRRFLFAEVFVSVSSPNLERFLNTCSAHGILLRRISRTDALRLTCRMRAKDFLKLPKILHGQHCCVQIIKRHGLWFRIRHFGKRPIFLLGAAMALCAIFFASGFVWDVSITHNGSEDRAILLTLTELGLYPGVRVSEVNEEQTKERVIAALPDLSWVGITVNGARVKIDYRLRTEKPTIIPNGEPCSIYAEKDGVLTKLYVYQGKQIASVGETVRKGDLLVNAEVPIGKEGHFVLAHALADAEARTWYEMTAVSIPTTDRKVYTGRVFTRKYLIFFDRQINLSPTYGKTMVEYDIIIEKEEVFQGVPCTLVTETYREYERITEELNLEAETARLQNVLTNTISAGLEHGRICSADFTVNNSDEAVRVTIACECLEDIAVPGAYIPSVG